MTDEKDRTEIVKGVREHHRLQRYNKKGTEYISGESMACMSDLQRYLIILSDHA